MRNRSPWSGPVPRGNDSADDAYPARTRLADERIRRALRRTNESWEKIDFGTATNGQRATYDGVYTFGAYTTGGVTIPGTAGATAVAMVPWTDGAGTVYLFQFVDSTDKMKVTDWAGTEIANGTSLAAITNHPFRAVLSAVLAPAAQSRLTGAGRVLAVEFETSASFAADAANFWTLTARLRRLDALTPQEFGETLGSFSTAQFQIVAQTPVALYDDENGTPFHDSDRVLVSAAATGNPLSLFGAVAWALVAREVE